MTFVLFVIAAITIPGLLAAGVGKLISMRTERLFKDHSGE